MTKIIILFIIILILYAIFCRHIEEFNLYHLNKIVFMNPKKSCQVIKNVDALKKYNQLDIQLRNIQNNVPKFYCDNLTDFTNQDKMLLEWLVNSTKEKTPSKLRFIYNNIKFGKYVKNIENGYPHTNKDVVFFDERYINSILPFYNKSAKFDCVKYIGAVLIHECVHVLQRKHVDLFDDLYINYWNFIKVFKIYNAEKYYKLSRYNPDGTNLNWIYHNQKNYIWLLAIYRNNAKNISHVDYVGIYLKQKNNKYYVPKFPKIVPILEIPEFTNFFENIHGNHYHPNELCAEIMSIYYLRQMHISHSKFKSKSYDKFVEWFSKTHIKLI